MDELGEEAHGGLAGLEEVLALEVALAARARERGQVRGTMLGQARGRAAPVLARDGLTSWRPATMRTRSR